MKEEEKHWAEIKKERERIFGKIITEDKVEDSPIGARGPDDFPVKKTSMIQDDMDAYIYPANFSNEYFADIYDEF